MRGSGVSRGGIPVFRDHTREVRLLEIESDASLAVSLSPGERLHAEAFRFAEDRRRFIACRSGLRLMLGSLLSVPPHEVVISRDALGKPFLPGHPRVHVSVAHSGDHGLLAVSTGGGIGVDIERMDAAPDIENLYDAALSVDERNLVESMPRNRRPAGFMSLWVQKEAFVKMTGTGFSMAPSLVSMNPRLCTDGLIRYSGSVRFLVWAPRPGYLAAIAYSSLGETSRPG